MIDPKEILEYVSRETGGGMEMKHFDERLIEEIGSIAIWEVDGYLVRQYIQKEFTNFAQPLNPLFRGKIPPDEFWIDRGADPAEIPFFIDHLLVEHYYMKRGMSYDMAEKMGTKVEERERHKFRSPVFNWEAIPGINPEIRLIQEVVLPLDIPQDHFWGSIEIFLADGKLVRDKIDPRFCSGGHSRVYGYIPENHIWIDSDAVPQEWPYFQIHELHEFIDMGPPKNMEYAAAHKIASRIEYACRWSKDELIRVQKELGLGMLRVKKI